MHHQGLPLPQWDAPRGVGAWGFPWASNTSASHTSRCRSAGSGMVGAEPSECVGSYPPPDSPPSRARSVSGQAAGRRRLVSLRPAEVRAQREADPLDAVPTAREPLRLCRHRSEQSSHDYSDYETFAHRGCGQHALRAFGPPRPDGFERCDRNGHRRRPNERPSMAATHHEIDTCVPRLSGDTVGENLTRLDPGAR